jgi:hypothetical protein
VVAAWRLGVEFTHVTIVPSKEPRGVCLGSVYLPDVVHPDVIVLPISEVQRLKIEKQILVNLAGPEAQMRFNKDCFLGTLAADLGNVLACLMTFRAEEARRNRWERVGALSTAARDGSGVR